MHNELQIGVGVGVTGLLVVGAGEGVAGRDGVRVGVTGCFVVGAGEGVAGRDGVRLGVTGVLVVGAGEGVTGGVVAHSPRWRNVILGF